MGDDELRDRLRGCDAFIFAAGVDERVEGPVPIYDLYERYNIDPIRRLLALAKEYGVRHISICGSYFAYFAKTRPQMCLTAWHPYIRSRIDQEDVALAFASDDFDVAVLELLYVFGTQPGRKPVWVFLVESVMGMKRATLWTRDGTTMITVRQVGQAIAGAIERNCGGRCYPIGWWNMTWEQLLRIVHKYLGCPEKPIGIIPKWAYAIGDSILLSRGVAEHRADTAGMRRGVA